MRDLSLHLLDLAQNSITAGAGLIKISLALDSAGMLALTLLDDGRGMDGKSAREALSPFGTSRATRKLGFGIPLTREHALGCGGAFMLDSAPGKGTRVEAAFDTHHLDCPPLGKLEDSLLSLVLANPETPDFLVSLSAPNAAETLDTRDIKRALMPLPVTTPEAALWLKERFNEMTQNCFGGIGR